MGEEDKRAFAVRDTCDFDWKKKSHYKILLGRAYYNIFQKNKYDKLPYFKDYLSEEYFVKLKKVVGSEQKREEKLRKSNQ